MLAPIVTKEMKLFSANQPIPPRIKNVRARAQNLNYSAYKSISKGGTTSMIMLATENAANQPRQRNSKSISNLNLPENRIMVRTSASMAAQEQKDSPSLRRPLDSIVEGIEAQTNNKKLSVSVKAAESQSCSRSKAEESCDKIKFFENFDDADTDVTKTSTKERDQGDSSPNTMCCFSFFRRRDREKKNETTIGQSC